MGWEWILHSDPGPSVGPFLGEEMLLMDPAKKMNLITSVNLCLRLKCGTILPMKLNKYAETRITKRHK